MSKYYTGYRAKCLIGKMHKVIIFTPVESFICSLFQMFLEWASPEIFFQIF
jgi:hypothetical protein